VRWNRAQKVSKSVSAGKGKSMEAQVMQSYKWQVELSLKECKRRDNVRLRRKDR
jgi:hypothetical protein